MARIGMLDVLRHERRSRAGGKALRLHFEPQLSWTAGTRRPHPSDEPRHGRGGSAGRTDRRRACPWEGELMPQPLRTLMAVAAPVAWQNVDTDQLSPVRFLRRPRSEGYSDILFHDLRFDGRGRERPEFVLNQPAFRAAGILIADRNFGVGSSREQAVWALVDFGIRCVIAESFGDIFYNNAVKHG